MGSYPSVEKQSVYSTVSADWATKTQKMILEDALFSIQYYLVRIKGKVE